ncbi:hypothetical protein HGA88_01720 [Candidatus Roizmanbacteria bacterium]|nr:hypothetical protein [Candidatus Roizmanbacteria bacterium]
MDQEQINITNSKFPVLIKFANEYLGENEKDIRYLFRTRPILLNGEGYWCKYEEALQVLSTTDLEYLLGRLKSATVSLSAEKGWPHFMEILNEALAYWLLRKDGYKSISFIDESSNGLSPDIEVLDTDNRGLIEVKTTRFSDNEYKAVSEEFEKGNGRFLDTAVHPTLIKKINAGVSEAIKQLWEYRPIHLPLRRIYLFLNLDDGNLLDIIFTPESDLKLFFCKLKATLMNGEFPSQEGKNIELKIYILSGKDPIEICE